MEVIRQSIKSPPSTSYLCSRWWLKAGKDKVVAFCLALLPPCSPGECVCLMSSFKRQAAHQLQPNSSNTGFLLQSMRVHTVGEEDPSRPANGFWIARYVMVSGFGLGFGCFLVCLFVFPCLGPFKTKVTLSKGWLFIISRSILPLTHRV